MMSWKWTVVAALTLLPLAACSDDDNESKILPIRADFAVTPVSTDPVVYLQKNPSDTSSADDVVLIDVMLRDMGAQPFDAFTLEVRFDPGVVQIGQVDNTATPLGDCRGSNPCDPLCLDNVEPTDPLTPKANTTGDLFIGVASRPLCPGHPGGSVRLLTLGFIAASVGTSPIELVDVAGSGDCEILSGQGGIPAALPIPCDDGNAMVVASR